MHPYVFLRHAGALCSSLLLLPTLQADTPLSLNEAIRRAWSHDPVVRVLELAPDLAEARAVQAGIRPNPQLSLDAELPLAGDSEWSLGVGYSQALTRIETLQLAQAVARLAGDTAPLHLRERERLLAGEVRHLVYALAIAEARATAVAAQHEQRAQTLRALQARHRAGEVPDTDLQLLGIETERSRLAADRANAETHLIRRKLAHRLRWSGEAPLAVTLDWASAATTAPASDSPQRPELALAQWTVEHADAETELARAQSIAAWTVGAGLHFARRANDATGRLEHEPSLTFGASRPWQRELPNRGEIMGKQAARAIAEAEADALRERIRIEILETAAEAAELATQTSAQVALLTRARALSGMWDDAYLRGEMPLLQRLQVDERLWSIEADTFDLAAASLAARARYETALGLVPAEQP